MRLHHKLILVFSVLSLAVLATGAAGLFVVSEIGENIGGVLEERVAIADASGEIVSIVASTEALLHEHMIIEDLDRMDQIRKEMENYHKIDNMWMRAIINGTESREFIESEEYQLWTEYGYEAKGIVIKKAGPDVAPIIEELNANHKKFHETAERLMELHGEEIRIQQDMLDTYSKAKEYRHSIRNAVIAQGDYLILNDMWRAEYEGKEALFQYRDKEHMDEWIEALETLETDVANSNFTPEIKSEILNYSAEYLLLTRKISGHVFKLDELDAEMRSQTSILRGHTADIDANVDDIRAAALAARIDAKRQVEAYIVEMYTILAVVTAVVIALILSVGYFTNKFISQPIVKLKDAAKKTGEGDFDVRIHVDRGDEIGELGTAYNEMTEALKKRTTDLEKTKKDLEDRTEKLGVYTEQLVHSNRIKGLFTDILRHDLLNPVGIIGNITDILEEDKNLKGSSEIPVIKRNVKKLEDIIRNASDYAKLESAEKMEKVELDLAKVIKSVIDDFGPYIKDKGMKVEFKPEGEHKINAGVVIESVFVNLLSNAIKYSPDGTEIKIAIEDSGKNWKVSFADQGEGIPDEYKEAIFDRFTRKDKSGVKGTGLGLAIVRRIVEMHGGRVWVEDNPGGGSIFYVEIPKSDARNWERQGG